MPIYVAIRTVDGYTLIILLTLFGFLALAAMLLVPVYRFLRREEQASREWTSSGAPRRRTDPVVSDEEEPAPDEESLHAHRDTD